MINFPQRNWTDYGGEVRGTTSFLNIKPGFFQYLLDKTYSGINKFLTCCSIK